MYHYKKRERPCTPQPLHSVGHTNQPPAFARLKKPTHHHFPATHAPATERPSKNPGLKNLPHRNPPFLSSSCLPVHWAFMKRSVAMQKTRLTHADAPSASTRTSPTLGGSGPRGLATSCSAAGTAGEPAIIPPTVRFLDLPRGIILYPRHESAQESRDRQATPPGTLCGKQTPDTDTRQSGTFVEYNKPLIESSTPRRNTFLRDHPPKKKKVSRLCLARQKKRALRGSRESRSGVAHLQRVPDWGLVLQSPLTLGQRTHVEGRKITLTRSNLKRAASPPPYVPGHRRRPRTRE